MVCLAVNVLPCLFISYQFINVNKVIVLFVLHLFIGPISDIHV